MADPYDAELGRIVRGPGRGYAGRLQAQIEHFTLKEAGRRDEIVLGYFGGAKELASIASEIARVVLRVSPVSDPTVLDVGAGAGTFTVPAFGLIREAVPRAAFYATDVAPAMLRELSRRDRGIATFVGIAEDLSESVKIARRYTDLPGRFDVLVSTLMLHHCEDVTDVLESINQVLSPGGALVLADLRKHDFADFREEMGDVHLGFDVDELRELAEETFGHASLVNLPEQCRCEDTGRTVDLFMLVAEKTRYSGPRAA